MLDFSNEDEQREFNNNGPVPAGSIVMVEMEVLQPAEERRARDNPFISVAQSGLRQIYCKFTVANGTYSGVNFRQNITLPLGAQTVLLSSGQEKACRIGGATLKAICLAARKPPQAQDVTSLTGLRFPVRVKINQRPSKGNGDRIYWNNEIGIVITPEKEAYATVYNGGEIIVADGPTTGSDDVGEQQRKSNNGNGITDPDYDAPPADGYGYCGGVDDVPF
jgi:hypothetical protein